MSSELSIELEEKKMEEAEWSYLENLNKKSYANSKSN